MLFQDTEQAAQEFAEMLRASEEGERVEAIETFLDSLDNKLRVEFQSALESFVS